MTEIMSDEKPTSTAWFEFLLNPSLLEKHLITESEPVPVHLILQFIFNGMKKNENSAAESEGGDVMTFKVTQKMKHVLSVLPLQIAAFLNWDITMLQNSLPMHILDALLVGLLQQTIQGETNNPASHSTLDTGLLLPYQLFSVALYHRYAVSTIVKAKLPSKPLKVPNVPIPGQQDPAHETREMQDDIVASLERGAEVSVRVLEQLLTAAEVRAPTLQVFSMSLASPGQTSVHRWEKCKLVPDEQFKFQIHYELGNYHFLMEKFSEALHHFSEALQLLSELGSSPVFCSFDEAKLKGFHSSCLSICGRSTPVSKRNLYDRFLYCIENDFEGLIDILTEDNIHGEIPFYLRHDLQLDLLAQQDEIPDTLLFHVQTLNAVGDVLQGRCWDSTYPFSLLQAGRDGAQYLVQLLGSKITLYSAKQKQQIRTFVETLSVCRNQRELLIPQLMSCAPLASLFTHEEIVALLPNSDSRPTKSARESLDFSSLEIKSDSVNDLAWTLIHSYDPRVLETSFESYCRSSPSRKGLNKVNVLELDAQWDGLIPIPVRNTITKLTTDPKRDLLFVLIAKAQQLTGDKSFNLALSLLDEALSLLQKLLPKDNTRPAKMMSWMYLTTKIQQQIHELPCVEESEIRKLAMESRQCLSLLNNNRESVVPWTNIVNWCVLLLLNTQDWASLNGSQSPPANHFPIMQTARPLAKAAQALQGKASNKAAFHDIFDVVARIIVGSSSYGKQPVMGKSALMNFVESVREPICLSLLISLLAHLYNMKMQDPSNALHVQHLSIWSCSYSDIDYIDKFSLREILHWVVDHATDLYSSGAHTNPALCSSWFLTKADLALIQKAHRKAIQNYLTSIFIGTNYLRNDSVGPDHNAVDDLVLKRMISCCMALDCYTQAAILCQFLETIDYNTAIGCLQERNAVDGMDAYYDCLFDVTLIEFIINIHQKKGEFQRRDKALKIIGLLELNSNNNEEIKREAAKVRKHRFLRAMGKMYL